MRCTDNRGQGPFTFCRTARLGAFQEQKHNQDVSYGSNWPHAVWPELINESQRAQSRHEWQVHHWIRNKRFVIGNATEGKQRKQEAKHKQITNFTHWALKPASLFSPYQNWIKRKWMFGICVAPRWEFVMLNLTLLRVWQQQSRHLSGKMHHYPAVLPHLVVKNAKMISFIFFEAFCTNAALSIYRFVHLIKKTCYLFNRALQKRCNHTTDEWEMLHNGTQFLSRAAHA